MDNVMENVQPNVLPLLPQLLTPQQPLGCAGLLAASTQSVLDLGEQYIDRYRFLGSF
jgi:hypothetical protein